MSRQLDEHASDDRLPISKSVALGLAGFDFRPVPLGG